jgi:hypothetical protein
MYSGYSGGPIQIPTTFYSKDACMEYYHQYVEPIGGYSVGSFPLCLPIDEQ